jgi:hypothetical protein
MFAINPPAFADPDTHASAPAQSAAPPTKDAPQIVTDEKNHAVRILIDGKDILTIDASGLHVNGGIAYSGPLTATGAAAHAH